MTLKFPVHPGGLGVQQKKKSFRDFFHFIPMPINTPTCSKTQQCDEWSSGCCEHKATALQPPPGPAMSGPCQEKETERESDRKTEREQKNEE